MHHEDCGCGNPSPWIELEGRTDDVTTFAQDGKKIKIPPLSVYAVLKEVADMRRFQLVVYNGNKAELRIEEYENSDKAAVFENARKALAEYLAIQGVHDVNITLSDQLPQQNPDSGKFKHVVNMQ